METLGLLKLAFRAAVNNVCFQEEEQSSPMTDLRAHSRLFVRGRIQIVSFWPTGSRKPTYTVSHGVTAPWGRERNTTGDPGLAASEVFRRTRMSSVAAIPQTLCKLNALRPNNILETSPP